MGYDTECPYCGCEQEINHDDGYGYTEDELYRQECVDCEKTFAFYTHTSFYYTTQKADCLNGGEHEMEHVVHAPKYWPSWIRCKNCDHEEKGEVDKSILP